MDVKPKTLRSFLVLEVTTYARQLCGGSQEAGQMLGSFAINVLTDAWQLREFAVRLFQTNVLGSLSLSAASVSEVQWRPHGSVSTFAGFEQKQWPIGELWGQSLWWNSGIIYVRV